MPNVIRVALPGYNAETDTNPDHFALYSDEDWILIKEFARGTKNIPIGREAYFYHNLDYVPFFLVYVYDLNGRADPNVVANKWKLVPNSVVNYAVAPFTACGGTNSIVITNNDTTTIFKYYVFCDQQV